MRGGAGRSAGCAGCAARGRRRRGSSARPRRRGEGASRPPPLPPGIRLSAAGEARRPGSLARPRPRLSAARSPAAGPLAESGRGPGGELCARVDVRGLARRAGGRPGAPLTRPGPAPRRPALPERAPPAARGPRTSSLGAGPAACQAEAAAARRRLPKRPLLDSVLRETSSVGFCSLAAESAGYAGARLGVFKTSFRVIFFFFKLQGCDSSSDLVAKASLANTR